MNTPMPSMVGMPVAMAILLAILLATASGIAWLMRRLAPFGGNVPVEGCLACLALAARRCRSEAMDDQPRMPSFSIRAP